MRNLLEADRFIVRNVCRVHFAGRDWVLRAGCLCGTRRRVEAVQLGVRCGYARQAVESEEKTREGVLETVEKIVVGAQAQATFAKKSTMLVVR